MPFSSQLPNIQVSNLSSELQGEGSSFAELGKDAYIEGFQMALGVLAGVLLQALLFASLIPKVDTASASAEEAKELVAELSSRRT